MSGPKLEKRMILGSSKLTRNLISRSWYFVLPIDEHQSFATFAFGTIKNLKNDLTSPSKITTIHPNPYGMGHTTLKYGSMYIGNIAIWKHNFSLEKMYKNWKDTSDIGNKNVDWKQNLYNGSIRSRLETEKHWNQSLKTRNIW